MQGPIFLGGDPERRRTFLYPFLPVSEKARGDISDQAKRFHRKSFQGTAIPREKIAKILGQCALLNIKGELAFDLSFDLLVSKFGAEGAVNFIDRYGGVKGVRDLENIYREELHNPGAPLMTLAEMTCDLENALASHDKEAKHRRAYGIPQGVCDRYSFAEQLLRNSYPVKLPTRGINGEIAWVDISSGRERRLVSSYDNASFMPFLKREEACFLEAIRGRIDDSKRRVMEIHLETIGQKELPAKTDVMAGQMRITEEFQNFLGTVGKPLEYFFKIDMKYPQYLRSRVKQPWASQHDTPSLMGCFEHAGGIWDLICLGNELLLRRYSSFTKLALDVGPSVFFEDAFGKRSLRAAELFENDSAVIETLAKAMQPLLWAREPEQKQVLIDNLTSLLKTEDSRSQELIVHLDQTKDRFIKGIDVENVMLKRDGETVRQREMRPDEKPFFQIKNGMTIIYDGESHKVTLAQYQLFASLWEQLQLHHFSNGKVPIYVTKEVLRQTCGRLPKSAFKDILKGAAKPLLMKLIDYSAKSTCELKLPRPSFRRYPK